ncbi:MAG: energy transducer TonB [Alphaproteobacteria bacterium HGW-Alphaproteobacteria-13]|jgi:protein TonB|nr:MAG: energy transducer TonB [Alphaproteobacteria bacterium HGW-Alphaproteobacteria-13]
MELASQAMLLRASDTPFDDARLTADTPTADIVPLSAVRERSRYGEGRRPNLPALAGSIGIVALILPALLTMNAVSIHKEASKLAVVEILRQPEPPPPPPPQKQPEPVKPVSAPSPVVAPVPLVATIPSPVQIATSPTPPPPEVSMPGPATPAPSTPAPAIASAGDLSSTMISAKPPRYPQESRRKREQGTVVLMVLLAADGTVADLSISQSSGFARLDQAALSAVRRWRWSPTLRGGVAVMVKGLVEIPFILQER